MSITVVEIITIAAGMHFLLSLLEQIRMIVRATQRFTHVVMLPTLHLLQLETA